jgi:hypothetical protein
MEIVELHSPAERREVLPILRQLRRMQRSLRQYNMNLRSIF